MWVYIGGRKLSQEAGAHCDIQLQMWRWWGAGNEILSYCIRLPSWLPQIKTKKQKGYLIPESLTTFCWKNGKLVFKKGRGGGATSQQSQWGQMFMQQQAQMNGLSASVSAAAAAGASTAALIFPTAAAS